MRKVSGMVLAALCAALLACTKDEVPTGIRVIVDSDLEIGAELTKLEVRVFDAAGEEELRRQDFALSPTKAPAQFTLPLSFRLAPESQRSTRDFLLVVTGIGPLGEGGSEIEVVEQQALASFRPGETLRLDMFLAKSCLLELCRRDGERSELSCDVATGNCEEVQRREDLPIATDDGIREYEAAKADKSDGGQVELVESDASIAGSDGQIADTNGGAMEAAEPQAGIAVLGTECSTHGARACGGLNSADALVCEADRWALRVICEGDYRCDPRSGMTQGTCQVVAAVCADTQPGDIVCDGSELVTCGDSLVDYTRRSCGENQHCARGTSAQCACDDGFETEGDRCVELVDCRRSACQHAGVCREGLGMHTCDCAGTGYDGDRCQHDIDECAAANTCGLASYPCKQTQAPGYTCLGQFADWPMPDTCPGARVEPSFDLADPDVAIDLVTGLMWPRRMPLAYVGCTKKEVPSAVDGTACDWMEAKRYCESLAIGNRADWRLPSKIELESLLDPTAVDDPPIDRLAFPDTPAGYAWTSSPAPTIENQSWSVAFFGGGRSELIPSDFGAEVRCVAVNRLAEAGMPSGRYLSDELSGVVADIRTGLVWQRYVDSGTYTWSGAVDYCDSLDLAGGGFRLPTTKELLTLVDPGRSAPAVDPQFFPRTPPEMFWTWSPPTHRNNSEYRRLVNFESGAAGFYGYNSPIRVRCVR